MKCFIFFLALVVSASVNAKKPKDPDPAPEARAESSSRSASHSDAVSHAGAASHAGVKSSIKNAAHGGSATGGNAEGGNGVGIGVGGAGGSSNAYGGAQEQSATTGSIDSDVLVAGDNINFEVAANKATLITSGCQTGGAADGVKFGISVIRQSPACLLLQSSTDALLFAASMDCADFAKSLAKGATARDSSTCHRTRSKMFEQAIYERNEAVDLLRRDSKQGIVKRLWRKIW